MRAGNRFRFSLQWGTDTEEKIKAGQFLERLDNKKSEIVVMALTEYMTAHPEIVIPGNKVVITVHPTQPAEELEAMVKSLAKAAVVELMSGMTLIPAGTMPGGDAPAGPSQDILDQMLDNLDMFK